VHDLVKSTFPAIKSTDNKPTPAVTPKTLGYIHALVVVTFTFHSTEAPYASALIVKEDVCAALNELTPSAFQTELRECLVYSYEKVCLLEDAGGLSSVRTKKHKFKKHKPTAPGLDDGPGDALLEGRPESDEEDNVQAVLNAEEHLQAAAAAADTDAAAPAPAAETGGGRGEGRRGDYTFACKGGRGRGGGNRVE
jgi:hypothetical protein